MPPRMRKRPKSRIHDSGKGAARQIIKFAREARDDPDSVVPDCAGECARCSRETLLQRLRKISSMAGDRRGLEWATRWGGDLERAYASIVLLAEDDDIQAVANICLGGKTVSYAFRGSPPSHAVAGLQNWDDPEVRLLAYQKTARKMGVCLYSTWEKIFCTGSEPRPPREFIGEVAEEAGYGGIVCAHKSPSPVKLRISFADGIGFEACEACASQDGSFASKYLSRSCERKPMSGATFEFALDPECDGTCGECPSKASVPVDQRKVKLYVARRLTDAKLLSEARGALLARLEPGTIVVGGRCFGKGPAKLVSALASEDLERKALEAALDGLDKPVLVDSMTVNKVLSAVWPERGEDVLTAVAGKGAASLFISSDEQPMNTIKQAVGEAKRASLNAALPNYRSLGETSSLADGTARAYKVGGQAAACDHLDRQKTLGHRGNSIALAFYIAMGQEANRMWKYSKEESDLGASLAPMAKDMLKSSGDAYDRALRHLLKMSGSGEEPS